MKQIILTVLTVFVAGQLSALTLTDAGYFGNSGDLDRPVQINPIKLNHSRNSTQAGPVYDAETGRLFMSAGNGRMNVYTIDGRMERSWKIPQWNFDIFGQPLVRCGNSLYFLQRNSLWCIDINAPDGASAVQCGNAGNNIIVLASSSRDGKLLFIRKNGSMEWFDPAEKKCIPLGNIPNPAYGGLDWNKNGDLFFFKGKQIWLVKDGRLAGKPWPKTIVGRGHPNHNGRFAGDGFFGNGWHGTIMRYDGVTLDPAPGVIMGGRGGHTFAQLFTDTEISVSNGIALIQPGIFALGTAAGQILIVRNNPVDGKWSRIRRIGALPQLRNMELDSHGSVFCSGVCWRWNDPETAPIFYGTEVFDLASVRFGADDVIVSGSQWENSAFACGTIQIEGLHLTRAKVKQKMSIVPNPAAVFIVMDKNQKLLYSIAPDGIMSVRKIHYDIYRCSVSDEQNFPAAVTKKTDQKFSDAVLMDGTVYAVQGKSVVLLNLKDGAWKEVSRWQTEVDPGSRIAADNGMIVVSEKQSNRVRFFKTDETLISELKIEAPGDIAVNGKYFVVYESRAQRVRKFILK